MQNNMDDEYDLLYKIVLVGETNVGKTHIVQRYIKNSLPKHPAATIGVEFATRVVSLKSGTTVKAQIWDTAGQERYHAIVSAHYRRAVGALLVYDVTDARSFANLTKWIEELRSKADPDIVIMLVGNKVDLVEKNPSARAVSMQQAKDFATNYRLFWIETSALTSTRVEEAFEVLLEEIAKQSQGKDKAPKQSDQLLMNNEPKSKSCCGN